MKALARELLGRTGSDEAELAKTARRLEALMADIRHYDPAAVHGTAPAFVFDPRMGGADGPSPARTAVEPDESPFPATDFPDWPATHLARAIRQRALSPVEVTRAFLERIAARDPQLNAFVTVMADQAMEQARKAVATIMRGAPLGPLHGVPVALKDIYEVAGVPTTANSPILADYVSEHDATVVARLRAAGAIIIGKTATHEFAYGVTTDSPFRGPTRNPLDPTRIPGGSSGGSGVAVAAGMAPIGMGTDTAGSIRIPAACCGVVGLKPTYGRVSKAGILNLTWSLDHPGPIARTVADAALVLSVIAGPDPLDLSAAHVPVEPPSCRKGGLKGVRIGVPFAWLETSVDPVVMDRFEQGLVRLGSLGADIVEVELPPLELLHFISRIITLAEGSAVHAPWFRDRAADYAPDVRARVDLGQYVLAQDYLLAQRLRTVACRQVQSVMETVHALATPTMAIPAPPAGQRIWSYADGRQEPVADAVTRFVGPFSVTGQPAISVPLDGLTASIQLVGRVFGEADLLRIAAHLQ